MQEKDMLADLKLKKRKPWCEMGGRRKGNL